MLSNDYGEVCTYSWYIHLYEVHSMSQFKRSTGNLLMCIAELLIGILLLIDPIGFTSGIIVVLGVLLTLLGIKSLVGYFRQDAEEASENSGLAKGLLFALLGLFCMFKSGGSSLHSPSSPCSTVC